jgi:hypothetical protein
LWIVQTGLDVRACPLACPDFLQAWSLETNSVALASVAVAVAVKLFLGYDPVKQEFLLPFVPHRSIQRPVE